MTEYGTEFFDTIREGCKRSAEVVVPLVLDEFLPNTRPRTVVDVGCGEGWWGKAFEDAGCHVMGVDGEYANPVIKHRPHDLSRAGFITDGPGWDLAVCLEVAEHLPPERAGSFIADLCTVAPVVLFSAAIPGQGGTGHLNEQWPGYWAERFEANGFSVTSDLRWKIWNDDRVENWYRQNLLLACSDPEPPGYRFRHDLDFDSPILPVVHPVLYDARRA